MPRSYHGKRMRRSVRPTVVLMAGFIAALALVLVACTYLTKPGEQPDPAVPNSGSQSTDRSEPGGTGTDVDGGVSQPEDLTPPDQSGVQPEEPTFADERKAYDFSQPAPASDPVDNSYFDDAAFVGDSRTDGFMIYSGIGTGKNLTSNGLSIFKLAEKKALKIGGKDYTLLEALALEQYGKVYLSLGVNELGYYDDEGFYESYCKAIDEIRKLQPNAVIYIQGLIPLNEERVMATSGRKYLENDHLRIYNDLMRKAAEEKQVVFLDLYTEFADENGALPADYSEDGVHLYKEPCKQWLEYLKTHTVAYDDLYPEEVV